MSWASRSKIRLAEHADPQLRVAAAALQPDPQDESSDPFRATVPPCAEHGLMVSARRHRSVAAPADPVDNAAVSPVIPALGNLKWLTSAVLMAAARGGCRCDHLDLFQRGTARNLSSRASRWLHDPAESRPGPPPQGQGQRRRQEAGGVLWRDVPDRCAAARLRTSLWRLRRSGADVLTSK